MSKRIDNDGVDGEPVGLFTTKSNEVIVIMLPTADVLNQVWDNPNSKAAIYGDLLNTFNSNPANARSFICCQAIRYRRAAGISGYFD